MKLRCRLYGHDMVDINAGVVFIDADGHLAVIERCSRCGHHNYIERT